NGITEVLKSGMIAEGRKAREFEKEFSKFTRCKHSIFVNNGTAALHLALETLDLDPGSEVITSGFTFIASANAISFIGAIPIFGDIDQKTWNLDPSSISKLITSKTKAIMPIHIFGLPSNMKEINEIAKVNDLLVIEDAAQGHGGKIDGIPVGNFSDISCFSFYATKNMITGEGGMVVTNNDDLADKARSIKNHGRSPNESGGYSHNRIGYNFRAPDYSAAIGLAQLKKLPQFLKIRKKNAEYYKMKLADLPLNFQEINNNIEHGNYIFAPCIDNEKTTLTVSKVIKLLRKDKIMARPIYDVPVYKQPAYLKINSYWRWARAGIKYPNYQETHNIVTDLVAKNHFEIPVHPGITEQELNFVIEKLKDIFSSSN
ncbi:MAG: DegT/DnrJ/EryC1/StrS family aminotransferase, partial [Candidatus Heimdallarchaeota archaeon]